MNIICLIIILSLVSFYIAKRYAICQGQTSPHTRTSLPNYYGWCGFLWCAIPFALLSFALSFIVPIWSFSTALKSSFLALMIMSICLVLFFKPQFHARRHVEKWGKVLLLLSALFSIVITIAIISSMIFEAGRFFTSVSLKDFLLGTHWSPQSANLLSSDDLTASFGALPLFAGTLLITFIAMCVAVPLGLLSAIYLSEYAPKHLRHKIKPVLEMLAGIPTVVYGYFAAITVGPFFHDLAAFFNLSVTSESALAAGLVMGVMIVPFIMSLSDDVINAVPNALREASFALGATHSETIKKVIIPCAFPGIISAFLLGVSRAIGETMIVVMAAGLAANLTANPFESVTTVTVQIATLLVGDQEFDSAKTLAAFALGLVLFVLTFILNIIALLVVKKYKGNYV